MTITLIATAKAIDANSYGTLDEANTYFTERLHIDDWDNAGEEEKKAALIWSGRLIDSTIRFNGTKTTSTQSMMWPRTGLTNNGEETNPDTVPNIVKYVQFELAMLLLITDRTKENDAAAAGLSSLSAGPISLSFKDDIKTPMAVPDTLVAMFPLEWVWRATPYILVVA